MNAIIMDTTYIIGNIFERFNRSFHWIGYTRAANELRRLGYYKESDLLLAERAKL